MARPHKRGRKRTLTDAQRHNNRKAIHAAWAKNNSYNYSFYLSNDKDSDIIDKLKSIPDKKEYVLNLIREDLKKNQAN